MIIKPGWSLEVETRSSSIIHKKIHRWRRGWKESTSSVTHRHPDWFKTLSGRPRAICLMGCQYLPCIILLLLSSWYVGSPPSPLPKNCQFHLSMPGLSGHYCQQLGSRPHLTQNTHPTPIPPSLQNIIITSISQQCNPTPRGATRNFGPHEKYNF